jgi:hypothetical protein
MEVLWRRVGLIYQMLLCIRQEDINIFLMLSNLVPCLIISFITYETLKLFMVTFQTTLKGREIQELYLLTGCMLLEETVMMKATNNSRHI